MLSGQDQLEGRNIVIEVMVRKKRKIHRVLMDQGVQPHPKIKRIVGFAHKHKIPLKSVSRQKLDAMSKTGVHNGVIAFADPLPKWTTKELLDHLFDNQEYPFLVLADELSYEHNLGAILRSAMGAGVHGMIIPSKRGKGLTPVVQRVAMGGAEEVPLIREGISSALAKIRKEGIRVIGADMNGQSLWKTDLRGPIALVMGGESKGLSPTLRKRCDTIVSIPLCNGLESLNVSVSAGIILYEKRRQEEAE
ncbi:MAG: 23S rRNA (guanosine(2251)-2'-O)-methyltransferase RlmB [Myxococcota bacterium]|nr:23S rRNA (guanosine(2251)-2'-O)-methyltransferase RlmB [Myxococcota bacterium]